MTTTKNRWLVDAIGTMRDYLRIGASGVRLKNAAGVLQVRNAGDSADANLKAALLQLSAGNPGAGKVLTSDASGNATWQTNAASGEVSALDADLAFDYFEVFGDTFYWTAGTPATLISSAYPYNWITYTTTDLASARRHVLMNAGTWEIKILTAKQNSMGKLSVNIGAQNILFREDLYNATLIGAHVITLTGVSISGNRLKEVIIQADTKNAASSAYGLIVMKIWGRRTG